MVRIVGSTLVGEQTICSPCLLAAAALILSLHHLQQKNIVVSCSYEKEPLKLNLVGFVTAHTLSKLAMTNVEQRWGVVGNKQATLYVGGYSPS